MILAQVESVSALLRPVLAAMTNERPVRQRPVVVDFGCGSGNLGLPLAALFPQCDFVLIDMKARAVEVGVCGFINAWTFIASVLNHTYIYGHIILIFHPHCPSWRNGGHTWQASGTSSAV